MLPVLPMLIPEVVGVEAAPDEAGNDGTTSRKVSRVLHNSGRAAMGSS